MRLLGLLCLTALICSAALAPSTICPRVCSLLRVFGSLVVLTAGITPSSATGTVTFYDGTTILGVSPVSNGVATLNTTLLAAGTHSLKALYVGSGATPFAKSLSAPFSELVNTQPADRFTTASGGPFNTASDPISVAVGDLR